MVGIIDSYEKTYLSYTRLLQEHVGTVCRELEIFRGKELKKDLKKTKKNQIHCTCFGYILCVHASFNCLC